MAELLARLESGELPTVKVQELSAFLRCGDGYIYKLIRNKALFAKRIGPDYRIPAAEAVRILRDFGILPS